MIEPKNTVAAALPLPAVADLEMLQHKSFSYFLHETNPDNGLVIDKTAEDWPASIAATGLALEGCVAKNKMGHRNTERYFSSGSNLEESGHESNLSLNVAFTIPSTCSGSKATLLPPRPLRTHRASFPAIRSSLSNAHRRGRGATLRIVCLIDLRVQLLMTRWMH